MVCLYLQRWGVKACKQRICGQCPYTLLIMKIQLHKVTRVYVSVCLYEKDKESVTLCSLVCCFVMLFSFIGLIFYVLMCIMCLYMQSLSCASVLK